MIEKRSIGEINYLLSRRAKKNITISISGGEVHVSAPKRTPLYEIEQMIKDKIYWINESLNKQSYKKNCFEDGQKIWYKGLEYEVKIVSSIKNGIEIFGNMIIINTKDINNEYVEKVFTRWLYNEAKNVFSEEVYRWNNIMNEYMIPIPQMQIRKMKSRWGSCIPSKKKICLNIMLMNVPVACMEYVVLHELTHFIEANHSKNFYKIIEKYMPDWKVRKNKLNKEFGNIL